MRRALWATAGLLVAFAANGALGGSPRPSLAQFIGLGQAGPAGCGCEAPRPAPRFEPKCCAPPPVCEPKCCAPPPCEPKCCAPPPVCQPKCEPCCQPCCEQESLLDRMGRAVFGRRVQPDPCGYSLWPCVGQCCDECQAPHMPHAPHGYGPAPEVLDPRMFSHPPDEMVDPFEDDARQSPMVPSAHRGGARTHSALHRSAGW